MHSNTKTHAWPHQLTSVLTGHLCVSPQQQQHIIMYDQQLIAVTSRGQTNSKWIDFSDLRHTQINTLGALNVSRKMSSSAVNLMSSSSLCAGSESRSETYCFLLTSGDVTAAGCCTINRAQTDCNHISASAIKKHTQFWSKYSFCWFLTLCHFVTNSALQTHTYTSWPPVTPTYTNSTAGIYCPTVFFQYQKQNTSF